MGFLQAVAHESSRLTSPPCDREGVVRTARSQRPPTVANTRGRFPAYRPASPPRARQTPPTRQRPATEEPERGRALESRRPTRNSFRVRIRTRRSDAPNLARRQTPGPLRSGSSTRSGLTCRPRGGSAGGCETYPRSAPSRAGGALHHSPTARGVRRRPPTCPGRWRPPRRREGLGPGESTPRAALRDRPTRSQPQPLTTAHPRHDGFT